MAQPKIPQEDKHTERWIKLALLLLLPLLLYVRGSTFAIPLSSVSVKIFRVGEVNGFRRSRAVGFGEPEGRMDSGVGVEDLVPLPGGLHGQEQGNEHHRQPTEEEGHLMREGHTIDS